MRLVGIFNAIALVAGLSPVVARAADDVFICRDEHGVREDVRMNVAQRKVTLITGQSPGRCIATYVDGVFGPIFTAPDGESCFYVIMGGSDRDSYARQYVTIRGNIVSWGAKNDNGTTIPISLDRQSGVLEYSGHMDECHRPHV